MTNEQIIGIISAAFAIGLLIGGFVMNRLHGKADKIKPAKGNMNLN